MLRFGWRQWVSRYFKGSWMGESRDRRHPQRRSLLQIEALEDRTVPTTFTVTTFADPDPTGFNTTTGQIPSQGNAISLRSAIMAANTQAGPHTIMLAAGTYTLSRGPGDDDAVDAAVQATGDLDLVNSNSGTSYTIEGAGSGSTIITWSATNVANNTQDRIFDVDAPFGGSSLNLTVTGVTLENGKPPSPSGAGGDGGAIRFIGENATGDVSSLLTLTDVVVTNNQSTGALGGGVEVIGSAVISSCTFSNNTANGGPAGGLSFQGLPDSTLHISTSTFDGNKALNTTNGSGAGIDLSGGATITIDHFTTISNNQAGVAGGGVRILSQGAVNITDTSFLSNTAKLGAGLFVDNADQTSTAGQATLTRVAFHLNSASQDGGAIFADRGTLTVADSVVGGVTNTEGNGAVSGGAGLAHFFTHTTGSGNFSLITVTGTTFARNVAGNAATSGSGAGILFDSTNVDSTSTLHVTNSTVSLNSSTGNGGGIETLAGGTANLLNVTVTSNLADSDNNGFGTGGGLSVVSGTVFLRNTLVAQNFRGTLSTADDVAGNLSGTSKFNLFGTGGSGGLTTANGNQINVANPGLGSLASNGGPTPTVALQTGSPAIDAGDTDTTGLPAFDQRGAGFPRVVNGRVDIGAFEAAAEADLAVTKTGPSSVSPGGNITYSITATNNGPSDAQTVALTDMVPTGTKFVSASTPAGWTQANAPGLGGTGLIKYTIASFTAHADAVFTIVVNADANTGGTTIMNTAGITGATSDLNTDNNSSTWDTDVVSPFTTSVVYANDTLTVTDLTSSRNDNWTLQSDINNSQFVISDPTAMFTSNVGTVSGDLHTVTIPFSALTTGPSTGSATPFQLNTMAGDDVVTVDYSLGNFFDTISYDGGQPNSGPLESDSLVVKGGAFSTITTAFAANSSNGAHGGTITLNASAGPTAAIHYSNLNPVLMKVGSATNEIFTLPAGAVGASLQDDAGGAGNNMSAIASTNGTFETTTFTDPTSSLTVNGGGGSDTYTTAANFSGDFTSGLTINGTAATDQVSLNALNLTTGTHTLSVTANTVSVAGAVSVGSGGAVTLSAGSTVSETAGGLISTTGTLTTSSAGGTTLGGANTVGTFHATNTTSGNISLTNTAATLTVSGISNSAPAGTIVVNNTGALTVSGAVASSNGDITLCDTGAMNLNATVNAGAATVRLQSGGSVAQSAALTAANLGVAASGAVVLNNAGNNVSGVFAASDSVANTAITFLDSVGFSTGTVSADGPCFPAAVTGVTTASGGNIGLTAATGNLVVASGAGISAGGTGTVTLTTSAATGDININAAVSSGTGNVTAQSGRNIAFNGGSVTTGGNVFLTSTNAAGTVTQTTAATSVTATSGNLAITAGGGVGSAAQSLVFNVNTLTSDSSAGNGNQFLADTATAHLAVANALNAGTGTLTLTAGNFQILGGAGGNAITDTSPVVANTPAVLDLNSNSETVWSLAGTGSVALGSGTLTTGNNSGDSPNFSGAISGSGGVNKVGSDTWTLSGTNTYTGPTNLNGGTLTVNGTLNAGAAAAGGLVNLNTAGVILNGSGTIHGEVTVVHSTFANQSQVQGVTVTLTSASGGTGITVPSGVVFVQIGTSTGVTVNGGNATSTGVLVQGSALLENSMFLGHNVDVNVSGGTAALQGDTLTPGTGNLVTGLLVQGGAVVDAGQLSSSATPLPGGPAGNVGYYGDITGLFSGTPLGSTAHSSGGNTFGTSANPFGLDTSATATPNPGPTIPQAIRNENTGTAPFGALANGVEQSFNYGSAGPLLGRMDTPAQGNTWNGNASLPLFQVEQLIFHDIDDNSVGFVTYGNTTGPAPVVVGTVDYSANFNLANPQAGTGTLFAGAGSVMGDPNFMTGQKSVIRNIRVTYSGYVFLDPNLQSPSSNNGLNLIKLNGPYGAPANTLIHAIVSSTLYNRTTGAYTVLYGFSGAGTESGSLEDGNYSLQFNESAIQGGGPGGPGLSPAGDPFAVQAAMFWRFFGDSNGDRKVDNAEMTLFNAAYRSRLGMTNYRATFDFNGDTIVDSVDYYQFLRRRGSTATKGQQLNPDGTVTTIP
jgi:predicted outer membrane repeat protein